MAEAYRCDRCGNRHDGQPNAELVLTEGRGRSRENLYGTPQECYRGPTKADGVEFDICAACRNDLKEYWAAAGDGKRSDLVIDDRGSEDE
jgi:hypothetical protein